MKTPFLYPSLFLLSTMLCAAAQSTPPAVLDTAGNAVQGGVKYVVVPVQPSQGGGLDLASTGNQNCPKSVVQVGPNVVGNTVTFSPVNPKDVVRNGTDLNVQFSGSNAGCPESTVWQITHDPEDTDTTHYVVSGGVKGNPSSSTTRNWFMIVKTKNGYKFKFCPVSVCDCDPICQDIAISVESGHRLLDVDVSLPPLEVNFKKA